MTKREKIAILKKMKKYYTTPKYRLDSIEFSGFCHAWYIIPGHDHPSNSDLESVGLKKPAQTHDSAHWYEYGKRGCAIRIRKINEAIKRLQKP